MFSLATLDIIHLSHYHIIHKILTNTLVKNRFYIASYTILIKHNLEVQQGLQISIKLLFL